MKVLLLNGSPKEKNSTYTALCEIKEQLEKRGVDSEIFWLGTSVDGGCRGCKACAKAPGKCAFGDNDRVNALIEKARECDGFVFATPVHYASADGNLTCALDRAFYSGADAFRYKPGAAVAVARRGGTTAALDQLNKYFTISCMPVVSSTYWNIVHGSNPEQVKTDAEGMQTMRNLADNMAWLIKSIGFAEAAGIKHPIPDRTNRTDFIR